MRFDKILKLDTFLQEQHLVFSWVDKCQGGNSPGADD